MNIKINLALMSHEEKDKLILDLLRENTKLKKQVKELKLKTSPPKKYSKNSSSPPSKDIKGNIEKIAKVKSIFHRLGGRKLAINPDKVVELKPQSCENCHKDLSSEHFKLCYSFDKIDLPEIRSVITRVNKYLTVCSNCKTENTVKSSHDVFSEQIKQMIFYLHYEHYVSFQRIKQFMKEVFGVEISEGTIVNILKSKSDVLKEQTKKIAKEVINAKIICCDETSARVNGKNHWEWVFQNQQVCLHVIEKSRGSEVKEALFGEQFPEVWVSDQYRSQQKGIKGKWQLCLAHLLRDCDYAIECKDEIFAPKMKDLFQRAIKAKDLDPITKKLKKDEFEIELEKYLALSVENAQACILQERFKKVKSNFLVFLDYDNVPPTNNSSEQALRPSVIFRKVTNCFRSEWSKDLFSYVRSVIGTAKRQDKNSFQIFEDIFTYHKNFNFST